MESLKITKNSEGRNLIDLNSKELIKDLVLILNLEGSETFGYNNKSHQIEICDGHLLFDDCRIEQVKLEITKLGYNLYSETPLISPDMSENLEELVFAIILKNDNYTTFKFDKNDEFIEDLISTYELSKNHEGNLVNESYSMTLMNKSHLVVPNHAVPVVIDLLLHWNYSMIDPRSEQVIKNPFDLKFSIVNQENDYSTIKFTKSDNILDDLISEHDLIKNPANGLLQNKGLEITLNLSKGEITIPNHAIPVFVDLFINRNYQVAGDDKPIIDLDKISNLNSITLSEPEKDPMWELMKSLQDKPFLAGFQKYDLLVFFGDMLAKMETDGGNDPEFSEAWFNIKSKLHL